MWQRRSQLARLLPLVFLPLIALAQESRGQATVALQGYYLGDSSGAPTSTTGPAITFQYYFDKSGQLRGSIEDYVDSSRFRMADNYLTWSGLPWAGLRWNLTGGDFRLALQPADHQIGNLFFPELRLRGVQIDAVAGSVTWSAYSGSLQVMQGARLPFSLKTPQTLAGGSVTWKRQELLEVQSSLVHISTDPAKLAEQPYFRQDGRAFATSIQGRVNALWRPRKQLRLQSEFGVNPARTFTGLPSGTSPWSTTASAEWIGDRFTVRGSYIRQGAAYMPLTGYFLGDRKGPFAEIRYKVNRRLEVYGTGALTESNVDQNPTVATMQAKSVSTGVNFELPVHLIFNAQTSSMNFRSQRYGESPAEASTNRQTSASLSRAFRRHNLRLSYRELSLSSAISPLRQRSVEVEEMVSYRRLTAGGAIRYDSATADTHRNGLYFRGNIQASFRHFSAYAFGEIGRDLANQSVFMTNQLRSSGAGLSTPLAGQWILSVEMMRNSLNTTLNEQSAFLLAANGAPILDVFPGMERWDLLVRVSKTLRWGGVASQSTFGRTIDQLYPVMGTIEGFVRETGDGGDQPVGGVPVQLDYNRTEMTEQNGRFRFTDVAQGSHSVQLTPRELPAEFDPASAKELPVIVQARRTARADLSIVRLGSLSGKIVAPKDTPLADVVIRLSGTRRYTSPDADGNFTIYNLPQGRYEVTIDAETLPPDHRITTPGSVPVTLKSGQPQDVILFGIAKVEIVKPIRRIDLAAQPMPNPPRSALTSESAKSPR